MHNSTEGKKISEQSVQQYSPMKDLEELQLNRTRVFIHDMDGMVQALLANTDLLKIKSAHTLTSEAVSYLQRIEENSKSLVNLLKDFEGTISLNPAHTTNDPDNRV